MKVSLVSITACKIPDQDLTPDQLIVYTARVSNPNNQLNHETGAKLLSYCMRHGHWSVFEMADMTVEIETSRAIAAQILRHRSFSFQEFSQRYSDVSKLGDLLEPIELRAKHVDGNRQGSGEEIFESALADEVLKMSVSCYKALIRQGTAPESARMILPLCTRTKLYMKGSVRSWIHYLQQRCSPHAQKEHRLVAEEIRQIFASQFPSVFEAYKEIL